MDTARNSKELIDELDDLAIAFPRLPARERDKARERMRAIFKELLAREGEV